MDCDASDATTRARIRLATPRPAGIEMLFPSVVIFMDLRDCEQSSYWVVSAVAIAVAVLVLVLVLVLLVVGDLSNLTY